MSESVARSNKKPPIEWLRKKYSYDPNTGLLTNLKTGKPLGAGGTKSTYITTRMKFENKYHFLSAHLIAWAIFHGSYPEKGLLIDHKNRNTRDNRIGNLRLATKSQNQFNNSKNSFGVYYMPHASKKNPYMAQVKKDLGAVHVGVFATRAEAELAYIKKAREIYGEFCPF